MAGFKELSLVAMFDEICRCSSVLQDATAESKFVEFLAGVRRERHVWSTAVDDCQRKHSQLVEANASVTRLQNCVKQAQNMFDHEQKRRKATEHDLCVMNERFGALRDLILNEPDAVATDARQKVLQWSQPLASPRDTQQQQRRRHSSSNRLGTISESVGSLLSFDDLSVDYTEDDLEASRLRSGRVRQHHQQQQLSRGQKRVSDSCDTEDDDGTGATRAKNRSRNAKRRNRQRSPDAGLLAPSAVTCSATGGGGGGGGGGGMTVCDHQLGPVGAGSGAVTTDALVATTTVVVPHSGPVTATSEIRARSASRSPPPRHQHHSSTSASVGAKKLLERSFSEPPPDQRNHLPSAAPAEYISGSDGDLAFTPQVDAQSRHHHPHQQQQPHPHQQRMFLTPAPSAANQYTPGPVLKHFGSAGKVTMLANSGVSGAHVFYEKMIIRPEVCQWCDKRINFGKLSLRCRNCRTVCHTACRDHVPLPCVPAVALTPTARGGHGRAQLADYVPARGLMVPALLQHCVHEIEQRAMAEVGIYRVPGSERQVQELKEKFFRGKGVPRLVDIECHVICGCVKDFLRSLIEPVVSYSLWHEFMRGAVDQDDSVLLQAVAELAKPNRDTLAFVISHLQRVSSVTENCMSKSNIARIFGPTLVGYSAQNLSPEVMVAETPKQHQLMERLLDLPADYWCRLIESALTETDQGAPAPVGAAGGAGGSGTPLARDSARAQPVRLTRGQRQRQLSYR